MAAEITSDALAHSNGVAASSATKTQAKLHGRAFYESIGSPKLILAPMVEQSEFVRLENLHLQLSRISPLTLQPGMAIALALLPSTIAADEFTCLLTHVPLEDVRREGKLPRLALPAA